MLRRRRSKAVTADATESGIFKPLPDGWTNGTKIVYQCECGWSSEDEQKDDSPG